MFAVKVVDLYFATLSQCEFVVAKIHEIEQSRSGKPYLQLGNPWLPHARTKSLSLQLLI
jgi:hypothetical protein